MTLSNQTLRYICKCIRIIFHEAKEKTMNVLGNWSENFRKGKYTNFFFLLFFFLEKIYNFMHFERHMPFKIHKIMFFPENLKKT